ncbi:MULTISPECIES: hypothetical protein [Pelosinus]|uniref:Uncharacterized protein n=1 Tax=Pelosinus fermentans B4 TaxID=1149862 RepID=I8RNQ0_9FIRM|nr:MULTISPECIES: hypothetical protein [Pelosinus]EIW20735.1 hypothetical protein FB4_1947 [Pelosinus fermentans B4]EIW25420.1 hypothetical protein FA11_2579 [Pelosinus fermentans A11]OAM93678.1 hypothetical protein FR7_01695 [Pelosinus fermentans DSM 17108]SDQ86301.1 hypothetical protein SAMN04515679_1781 [Pelosinus fermentans]
MNLENSIKDVISKKLEDGSIEKLIEEQLEKGVKNALDHMFGSYGDVTKIIETQIKSVMIPYLEKYDYSEYLIKLDNVLVDVLKGTSFENKNMLENFKELMLPEDRKVIKASELFEIWSKYVAKNVETHGLEVNYDDGEPTYEYVEITLDVNYDDKRSWSSFQYATLALECEHDDKMNFALRISHYDRDKENQWDISYDSVKDIGSMRHLNSFEILLMRLSQARTKLIMDIDSESDEITPEKEPEASYS